MLVDLDMMTAEEMMTIPEGSDEECELKICAIYGCETDKELDRLDKMSRRELTIRALSSFKRIEKGFYTSGTVQSPPEYFGIAKNIVHHDQWFYIENREYGVCDDIEQIKKHHADVLNDPNYPCIVHVTRITKDKDTSERGWRWHKWGEYIGTKEPQCEYLNDEPEIDSVLVYHVHKVELK